MTGAINGIALQATVVADYKQTPCAMKVLELNVTEFGKIDMYLTGFSIFDPLISFILNLVINQSQEEIVKNLEKELRGLVESKLATFNCEGFRGPLTVLKQLFNKN